LSQPLASLFTIVFNSGAIPKIWNSATVIPLFKKGKTCSAENYRPISLTCVICKIFESIIKDELLYYFNTNNLLHDFQHSFLAGASTSTNLISCLNDWTLSLKNKHSTRVIYIDFARAFDSVSHPKLMYTLSQKNDTNSNSYISDTDYPIFVIFYSHVLGECKNMPPNFQAIWWSR
jgi:hypothetical protein